nr:hypothetical protein [Tanacetum cinerariifolium]
GRKRQQFYGFAVNRESALDVYSKRRIIAVIDLKIVKWHNYKHLDWISVRRDDDKIYKFKEGDFKRLCLQDIEDMLLLLDVYEEYRHSAACGRSSTGSRKLPEEAQPYKARHVSIRSKATRSVYCLFKPNRIYLSKQEAYTAYDDDDDYSAVTPSEPIDSLSMGDKHLDTIPATKSDELIKSCVENLVLNPSESEGENGCDVPSCFTTFSNILFDDEYKFDFVDDQSLHNEKFSEKIFSNPELTLLKSIPPGIDETDYHPENEIRLS